MTTATCEMVRVVPDDYGQGHELPPCGKPRRRRTCCDECFEKLIASGGFTREEAEREYPFDWPAFWRSLPPREQWEAAKAMPKIAGPWKAMPGEPTVYQRDSVTRCAGAMGEEMTAAIDDPHAGLVHARAAWGDPWIRYPDRASADAALRAAGWVLCDEETSR